MNYREYIVSEEWYNLKIDLLVLRGCKCEKCGIEKAPNKLHLHHLSYDRLFNELGSDLQLLCAKCHMKIHNINQPKKKKNKKVKKTNKSKTKN